MNDQGLGSLEAQRVLDQLHGEHGRLEHDAHALGFEQGYAAGRESGYADGCGVGRAEGRFDAAHELAPTYGEAAADAARHRASAERHQLTAEIQEIFDTFHAAPSGTARPH